MSLRLRPSPRAPVRFGQRESFLGACVVVLGAMSYVACGDDTSTDAATGATTGDGTGGTGAVILTATISAGTGLPMTGSGGSTPSCPDTSGELDVEWAASGASGVSVFDVDIAPDGSTVVAGSFVGTLVLGGTTLTSQAQADGFVAKLAPDGAVEWAARLGGSDEQVVRGVAFDASGDVVVVGQFFDNITIGSTTHTAIDLFEDIFVAKLSGAGAYVFSQRYGTGDADRATGVAIAPDGGILLTGQFKGTLDFGDGGLDPAPGEFSAYAAKLSGTNGAAVWSRSFGDGTAQSSRAIATDITGNVYIAGDFTGSIDVGSGSVIGGGGESTLFAAKLGPTGMGVWAKAYGSGAAAAEAIALGPDGAVLVGGWYRGTIDFGGGTQASGNGDDALVFQLSSAGELEWVKTYGSDSPQLVEGVGALADGSVYITGTFGGEMSIGKADIVSAGGADVFVAKLDADGCAVHAAAFGDASNQTGAALAASAAGVRAAGVFDGTIDPGTGAPLTASGTGNLFVLGIP